MNTWFTYYLKAIRFEKYELKGPNNLRPCPTFHPIWLLKTLFYTIDHTIHRIEFEYGYEDG